MPPLPERVLQRLDWTVLRRLDGLLQGDYRTVFRGHGLDLADIREYVLGDDVRYIDWNVTARMGLPYVREWHEDREITAHFLLDLSPSMEFGTAEATKRDLLIDLVGALARVLTRRGNRVGAIVFSGSREDVRVIPARGGRVQVLRILGELMRCRAPGRAPFTRLGDLLGAAGRTVRRRSLLIVVSDLVSEPGWERLLGQLARRHEVLAVRIGDPRERALPDIGGVWMNDAETGEQVFVDTGDARFRARFAEAVRRRDERLAATLRRARVDVLELSTEDDLAAALLRFALRRRRRRGTRAAVGAP